MFKSRVKIKTDTYNMYKRGVLCFFILICLFLSAILRLAVISAGDEYMSVQKQQSSRRITVAPLRGTVYDKNMIPLTNNKYELYAAVPPLPDAVMSVPDFLWGEEKERVLGELNQKRVAVCKPMAKVTSDSVITSKVYYTNPEDFCAEHIIGYTDSSGHGVCGIEKAYDSLLYSEKTVDAVYTVNGLGNTLYGEGVRFDNDLSALANGVVLTVDINIQNIIKDCSEGLNKGAIVVCEAQTGKIRGMLSAPSYRLDKISDAVDDSSSPLLNRALMPFAVGSVFKPCVAAAAIENGTSNFTHNCTGKLHIIDRDFSCHKKDGHGTVNLGSALAFSCNTFFYKLAINTGAEKIYKTARRLNLGSRIKLCENLYSIEGNLTIPESITNDALLANFGIGQGSLTLSPVSMLTLYMSIATDGTYYLPSIVEKTVKDGKYTNYDNGLKARAMQKSTADKLKEYLKEVVLSGTGTAAAADGISVAGKTATAQTGRYAENGSEITNSWFCGFFPAEKPQYVVAVMSEGASEVPVASIFSKIAQKMSSIS